MQQLEIAYASLLLMGRFLDKKKEKEKEIAYTFAPVMRLILFFIVL